MYDIRKKFNIGNLVTNAIEKSVDAGILNPNSNSLQDYESFVVTNPDLVDESIDVSGLRTQTDTSPYLLGNIPNYSGIQYEAYNPNRLSDLMRLYSGGLPTFDTDTAQIPGAIDTLVDVGDGGGGGANVDLGGNTDFENYLINEGIGVQIEPGQPVVAPGEIPVTQQEMDDFNAIPVTQPNTGGITGDPIEMENLSPIDIGTVDDYDDLDEYERAVEAANISGIIGGAPVVYDINEVGDPSQNPGSINVGDQFVDIGVEGEDLDRFDSISQVQVPGVTQADLTQAQIDEERIANYTPSTDVIKQEDIQDDRGLLQKLGLPEDFDLKKAGIELGINYMVGAPVSLIKRALDAIPPSASQLAYDAYTPTQQSIIDQEFGPGGLLDNLNPVSMFGKDAKGIAEESLNQRLDNVGIDQRTLDLANLVESLGGDVPSSIETIQSGDIQDTGDASVAEEIAAADRAAAQAAAEAAELDRQNREADAAQAAADRAAQAAAEAAEKDRQQREADIAEAAANREAARNQDNSPGNPANQNSFGSQANSPGNPANQGGGDGDGGNGGGNGGGGTHVCTASYANNLITTLDFKSLKKYGIKLRRNDKYLMKAYDWFGPKLAAAVKKGKLVNFAKHSTSMWKYEQTKKDVSFKIKFMSRLHKIITRPILRALGALLTIKEKLTK